MLSMLLSVLQAPVSGFARAINAVAEARGGSAEAPKEEAAEAEVKAAFPNGEAVYVDGRDDFGYFTPAMKEKDFDAAYNALGDKVYGRIRVEK